MELNLIAFTDRGYALAQKLAGALGGKAVRGGKAGSLDRAGLNALHFYNPRTYDGSATIGFRSAFVE